MRKPPSLWKRTRSSPTVYRIQWPIFHASHTRISPISHRPPIDRVQSTIRQRWAAKCKSCGQLLRPSSGAPNANGILPCNMFRGVSSVPPAACKLHTEQPSTVQASRPHHLLTPLSRCVHGRISTASLFYNFLRPSPHPRGPTATYHHTHAGRPLLWSRAHRRGDTTASQVVQLHSCSSCSRGRSRNRLDPANGPSPTMFPGRSASGVVSRVAHTCLPLSFSWSHCHTFLHAVPSPPHALWFSEHTAFSCVCEWKWEDDIYEWEPSDLKRRRNFCQWREAGWSACSTTA
jgi:hypothetical protein